MRAAASSSAAHRNGAAASASRVLPVARAHQHHAQAEEAEVEPQHQAVSQQQQRRRQRRHVAVVQHRVAHPVAVARCTRARRRDKPSRKPRRSGRGRSDRRLAKEAPTSSGTSPNQAKIDAPGRHRPGQRKRQLQQGGGERRRGPQLPGLPNFQNVRCIQGRVYRIRRAWVQ